MRKVYEKPEIEVSLYLVNEAFAACTTIIDLGPSTASYASNCSYDSKYGDLGDGGDGTWETSLVSSNVSFYLDNEQYGSSCTCYYTSGDATLTQS